MGKIKLMTILGTRPEIIRLSEVIKKCDEYFEHILVHTGQNYDNRLNEIFFEELSLRAPDYYLDAVGKDLGETIGNIISKSYKVMVKEQPDAVLILGDTNSALSAISAKRLKIPVFHMEAGNRCFDEMLPEEVNRRMVDNISDVNMCYTEHARRYLFTAGLPKDRIFVTGSPMPEVLSANLSKILLSNVLKTLGLEKNKYILLSAHREENIDDDKNFYELMHTINALADEYQMPVIYSTHPRSRKKIEEKKVVFHPLVRSLEPFGFFDFNCLQLNSFCVVSDSGTLPEEASFFAAKNYAYPAVVIRNSTERPEALDTGNFILGNVQKESVLQAVKMAVKMNNASLLGSPVNAYADENVSVKAIKIIQSYTAIINKVVWNKQ